MKIHYTTLQNLLFYTNGRKIDFLRGLQPQENMK